MRVFKSLRVVDAQGKPRIGESSRTWMLDLSAAVFGAYDAESGRRLINEFFLLISKKNGKSSWAAAVMLTALLRNWRQSAEFIILAPTIEIANNSADPAMDMVAHGDPELRSLLRSVPHQRLIEHRTTGATLKILAADSDVVGGKKATGVLIDELWLFGKKANAENMFREAFGGLASRPEGFVIALSTQSDEPPAGVFKQWLNRYRGIRDGEIKDPHSLGVLYEFPDEMIESGAYKDPKNLYVTNPNLGLSTFESFIEQQRAKAEEAGQHSEAGFYSKHLNVEIGQSRRGDRWSGADYWEQNAAPALTLEALIEQCEVIEAGVDGGGLDDLLSLSFLGRKTGTREWLHWSKHWAHQIVLKRRKGEASRLRDFEKEGDLEIVEDLTEAFASLAKTVSDVEASGKLDKVCLDPAGVGLIIDALEAIGLKTEDRISAVSQGWKLMGPIKTTEVKLSSGELTHAGQAIMAWAVGNAKAEKKGNADLITKQAAGSAKIDPLMSLFDAAAALSMNPEAKTKARARSWVL